MLVNPGSFRTDVVWGTAPVIDRWIAMKSNRVGQQLGIGFSFLIVLLIVLGSISLRRMAGTNAEVQEVVNRRWHMVQLSQTALHFSTINSRVTMQIFLTGDQKQIADLLALRALNTEKISRILDEIKSNVETDQEKALLAKISGTRQPYIDSYLAALNLLLKEGKPDEARSRMVHETLADLLAYHNAWEAFVDYQGDQMDKAGELAQMHCLSARQTVAYLLVIATILAIGIAFFVIRAMTTQIVNRQKAEQSLRRAQGELEDRVRDRTARLASANELLQTEVVMRTQAEASLKQAKEAADAANLAKSEFLTNMSHEIRTPLNGVVGMIDLLRHTNLDESQLHYTSVARSSADALLTVINDILDYSKIEAGRMELESQDFDLAAVIENVAESLAAPAANKGLEIGCIIRQHVPDKVIGDAARLAQILNNLANNAIKFTERGRVIITASLVGEEGQCARVKFAVTDTGIGIAPDRKDRLFQSFSQIDASTTRKYGGNGLGLAISKRLVHMMGGEIGVESELGKGSTFWFIIPMTVSAVADPSRKKEFRLAMLKDLRVLAVDDNPVGLEIIKEQLAAWDLDVSLAPDGPAALSILAEKQKAGMPIDLVVLDWHMPDMDGLALAKAVRATPGIATTALISLTGVDDGIMDPQIKELNFSAHLTKPLRQSRLLDAIADAMSKRNSVSAESASPPVVARQLPADSPHHKAHLLVAEDNEINRLVAEEILAGCGYTFEMVESGDAALAAAFARRFDLILMDCQMPGMDGLEATRAIRAREKSDSRPGVSARHIPIIAVTANAIKGDREICLAAGMDDYVSKPINAEKLIAAIEGQLMKTGDPSPIAQTAPVDRAPAEQAGEPIDMATFLGRCFGNKKIASKILAMFQTQVGKNIEALQSEIAAGNADQLRRSAHTLKGCAANISAEPIRQLAAELERLGATDQLSGAGQQLELLKAEADRCLKYIAQTVQDEAATA
jgi:Amt family ammonium transporter